MRPATTMKAHTSTAIRVTEPEILAQPGCARRRGRPVQGLVDDEAGHPRQDARLPAAMATPRDAHGRQPAAVGAGVRQDPPPERRVDPALEFLFLEF